MLVFFNKGIFVYTKEHGIDFSRDYMEITREENKGILHQVYLEELLKYKIRHCTIEDIANHLSVFITEHFDVKLKE